MIRMMSRFIGFIKAPLLLVLIITTPTERKFKKSPKFLIFEFTGRSKEEIYGVSTPKNEDVSMETTSLVDTAIRL